MNIGLGMVGYPPHWVPPHWVGYGVPYFFFIFGSQNAHFGALSGPFECLLLRCNTSRSGPPVCLDTLTFQADCGSIKGAGVPAEEGTEHYLHWWWIRGKCNHCQRRNTESRRQQLSQLFLRRSWVGRAMLCIGQTKIRN